MDIKLEAGQDIEILKINIDKFIKSYIEYLNDKNLSISEYIINEDLNELWDNYVHNYHDKNKKVGFKVNKNYINFINTKKIFKEYIKEKRKEIIIS